MTNKYDDLTDQQIVDRTIKKRKLSLHQDYYRHRARVILDLLSGEEIYDFSGSLDTLDYARRIAAVKDSRDIKWSFWRQIYWIIKILITRG